MAQELSKGFPDPDGWRPPVVALVGMGMGREDLSVRALSWIEQAEVLVGGRRHVETFPEHRGERLIFGSSMEEILALVEERSKTARVAVLASGDPFFFGVGRRLLMRIGSERLVTLPNVTSVQSLFARMGKSWEDVRTVSLHGRDGAEGGWLRLAADSPAVAFLTDPKHTPAWIARNLLDAGLKEKTLVVGEDLGLPTERIVRCTLGEAAERPWSLLNVVAVLDEESQGEDCPPACTAPHTQVSPLSLRERVRVRENQLWKPPHPGPLPEGEGEIAPSSSGFRPVSEECVHRIPPGPLFGLPEEAFAHEAGLITKLEVRAVVLALLQLERGLVLWDLGAGSGSVAIEASRLAFLKRVIAVEKHPDRFRQLEENMQRLGGGSLEARQGSAAAILPDLPDPDRVFVGGSGGDLSEILNTVARRLRPGGRMVLTAVMLDTLEAARRFWEGKPFHVSVTQLQINRSQTLAGSLRLEPLNPVFILTACRV